MKDLLFYKYQSTGNDFIMIDNRLGDFSKSSGEISKMCHRRFGIGADGLILIGNASGYDFAMRYFNADGKEGSFCGNGARSAVKFASFLGIIEENAYFIASDGEHHAEIIEENISLKMNDVSKVDLLGEDYFLNTGSPHLVIFKNDLDSFSIKSEGSKIRNSPYWFERGGVNVNFVKLNNNVEIEVRTFERGVEDETYSCGTGVVAAALSVALKGLFQSEVKILTRGGDLKVNFQRKDSGFEEIYLLGGAELVFHGVWA